MLINVPDQAGGHLLQVLIECDRDLGVWHHIMEHVVVLEEVPHKCVPVVVIRSELLDQVCGLASIPASCTTARLHILLVDFLDFFLGLRAKLCKDEYVLVVVMKFGARLFFLSTMIVNVGKVFGDF